MTPHVSDIDLAGFDCKLVVLDVDGTFLAPNKLPTEAVMREVSRIAQEVAPVAFATGRMYEAISHWVRDLGLQTPQIGNNGADLVDPLTGERLYKRCLPNETVRWLLDRGLESELTCIVFAGTRVLGLRHHPDDWLIERNNEHVTVITEAQMRSPRLAAEKLLFLAIDRADDLPALRDRLCDETKHIPHITFDAAISEHGILNFCHPDATKLNTLRLLCDCVGCTLDQVLAVGDGDNDADILEAVGLGVAMGNASPKALAAAHAVGPSNEEDGLAAILRTVLG